MKVLVACEESQTVTKAFRERGHEAYSCDLQPCSGGRPEWHIQGDALDYINTGEWDLLHQRNRRLRKVCRIGAYQMKSELEKCNAKLMEYIHNKGMDGLLPENRKKEE